MFAVKSWIASAEIGRVELVEALELARQEPAAEWRIGDESDARAKVQSRRLRWSTRA
jgi:hypothetical protein